MRLLGLFLFLVVPFKLFCGEVPKQFDQAMTEQIAIAEQLASERLVAMQGGETPKNEKAFYHAFKMLLVKQSLKVQFKGSPTLQSSVVREHLLQVMKKPNITEEDLLELQQVVDEEKFTQVKHRLGLKW